MNNGDRETPAPTPDDSQKVVEQKTLSVAIAVQDLVAPVKQVLKHTRSVMNLARVAIALSLVLLTGLGISLWRQSVLLDYLKENAVAHRQNAKAIASVVAASNQTAEDVADVKAGVDEIPRIDVQPADTTDPTSKPVAVLRPGKVKKPAPPTNGSTKPAPPPPAGIEIRVDVTHQKAHPKKKK